MDWIQFLYIRGSRHPVLSNGETRTLHVEHWIGFDFLDPDMPGFMDSTAIFGFYRVETVSKVTNDWDSVMIERNGRSGSVGAGILFSEWGF